MKLEIFKSKGLEIHTSRGSVFFPDDVIDSEKISTGRGGLRSRDGIVKAWSMIKDHLTVKSPNDVYGIYKIDGWFGKLSILDYSFVHYIFHESEEVVKNHHFKLKCKDEII